MRILKFRLVKDNKIVATQELKPNGIIDCPVGWDTAYQFTGLLDKQGKEIYEGDILKVANQGEYREQEVIEGTGEVKFDDGGFKVFGFYGMGLSRKVCSGIEGNWNMEIIGNLYENPELLNQ
jgi:uncharacterized phage protein (TIGR01671 family)